MRMSDSINELATALAKAQGQFTNPERNREVEVRPRESAAYKFRYATFDAILDVVRKPLSENGLALVQGVATTDAGLVLTTKLLHATGQWIESDTPVFYTGDKAQAFGSGVSYAKRYAVAALLGITADEDDDGNNASGNAATYKDRAPRKTPPRSVETGRPLHEAHNEITNGTASTVPQGARQPIDKTAPDPKRWAVSDEAADFLRGARADLGTVQNGEDLARWVTAFRWQQDAILEYGDGIKNKNGASRADLLNGWIGEAQDRCRAPVDMRAAG